MGRKKLKINYFLNKLFFLTVLSIGIILILILIWPGILKNQNRRCFFNIIEDGIDGKVSIGTILSIEPNYLLKINSTKRTYKKILLIGDYCFRNKK